jgi:hypothetical protein
MISINQTKIGTSGKRHEYSHAQELIPLILMNRNVLEFRTSVFKCTIANHPENASLGNARKMGVYFSNLPNSNFFFRNDADTANMENRNRRMDGVGRTDGVRRTEWESRVRRFPLPGP